MLGEIRILLVAAEADFANLTAAGLERENDQFTIRTAASAGEGLDALTDDIDCVVSAYQVPDMDGLEFFAAVREEYPYLPFILFTGTERRNVASEAIAVGVTDCLQKGHVSEQPGVLANRITNVVEQNRERERSTVQDRVVQEMNDVAVIVQEGVVKYTSPGVSELLGYAEEYPPDRPMTEFIPPESQDAVRKRHQEWLMSTEPESPDRHELELLSADGQRVPVEVTVSRTEYEEQPATLSVIRDITERKRQQKRFRTFIEHSTDIITVLDQDGTYRYQSQSSKRILGYEPSEMLGDSAFEYVHPDDRDAIVAEFEAAIADPEMTPTAEYRIQHRDGSWRWMESVGNNQLDNPAVEGFVVNSRDITGRKERERELRATNRQLSTVVSNIPVVLFMLDSDGVFTVSEGEGLSKLGLEPGEVVGESVFDVYATHETIVADARRALDGEAVQSVYEVRGLHFETTWQPVVDDAMDAVTEVIGVAHDVTSRVERAEELQRKNERLDQFASTVAHDIRNPLHAAQARLELAEIESDEHRAAIESAHERMEALIDDLLTLARSGQRVRDPDLVALADAARDAWEQANVGDCEFESGIPAATGVVADRDRLLQVFENLYRNAADHNDTWVTVRVGMLGDREPSTGGGQRTGFFVEDTGSGIPDEQRDALFEYGYTTSADGTGYGLSIVRDIVEAHGWDIRVADGTDGGARFEITRVDTDR